MDDSSQQNQLRFAAQRKARQGHTMAALRALDDLIGLGAANDEDWLITGRLLCDIGEFAQALGAFENCLQIVPHHLEARYELGRALYKLGDADGAAKWIEQVAEETGQLDMWMGLATIAPAVPSYDHGRVRKIRERFAQLTRQVESPAQTTLPGGCYRSSSTKHSRKRNANPLRIGYVSAHWREANYMKPVWPVINAHDRARFELYLFDDGTPHSDTWHWLDGAAHTESIYGLDNREAAQRIGSVELDVLVDLSAYSQPDKYPIFAFGCLGTLYKISPQVIATWSEILRQAPTAQLVLSARELKSVCNQQYLSEQFQRQGVSAERLMFLPPATHFDFLKHYALFDVALDTFPYNGGTTTMEALWQGVPVLTFAGDRWVSRTSHSLLTHSHLSKFSVASRDEYVRTAIDLATQPELRDELQLIRQQMRQKLANSRICDSQMLTAMMEALYISVCS